jgi:4-hydroxy-tetrahydrodipicolinate synthase
MSEPSTPPQLEGVWVPIITPFADHPGREVDHAALGRLAKHLQRQGVSGLVVGGTTGEAAALTPQERLDCWHTVAQHAPALPLMLGTGGASLADALEDMHLIRQYQLTQRVRLDALLLAAPSYVRPSQQGLRDWFLVLADAAPAPVVMYDIPYRTGSTLARETLLSLADHPNIIGIKDCGGDLAKTLALLHDGRLQVLAGEDLQVLAHLAHGGKACISASAHLHPQRWVRMVQCMRSNHLDEAQALWRELVPLIETAFSEPNPGPLKAALAIQGFGSSCVRAPMMDASPAVFSRWKCVDWMG